MNKDFPGGSDGKASVYNAGDVGLIPGLGRSPGEGNGNPLQYYFLENPMDRGAWSATVHEVAKCRTRLNDFTFTLRFRVHQIWKRHSLLAPWFFKLHWNIRSTALRKNIVKGICISFYSLKKKKNLNSSHIIGLVFVRSETSMTWWSLETELTLLKDWLCLQKKMS